LLLLLLQPQRPPRHRLRLTPPPSRRAPGLPPCHRTPLLCLASTRPRSPTKRAERGPARVLLELSRTVPACSERKRARFGGVCRSVQVRPRRP